MGFEFINRFLTNEVGTESRIISTSSVDSGVKEQRVFLKGTGD